MHKSYDQSADDTNIQVHTLFFCLWEVRRESCYAGSRWSLNRWVLSLLWNIESDSSVLTLVRISFHHWGAKTEKSRNFAEWALFSLSDEATSWPADVKEQWCWVCRTVRDWGLCPGSSLLIKAIPCRPRQWLTGPCKGSLSQEWIGVQFY